MPAWADAGRLLPLPADITTPSEAFGWMGLLPLYRERLLVWNKSAYSLPLVGESPLCCYRSDWLADPKYQNAFRQKYGRPLGPPATWKEFDQIAEFFHQAAPDGRPAGLPPLPDDDEGLARVFYQVAAPLVRRAIREDERGAEKDIDDLFYFYYAPKTGQPRIAAAGFVEALKRLRHWQTLGKDEAGAGDPVEVFAGGQAVLCLTDASRLVRLQQRDSSKVRDRFGICQIPGAEHARTGVNRIPYLGSGGWLMVVPGEATNAQAAFSLMADLAGKNTSTQILLDARLKPAWAGGPTRLEHLDDRVRWDAFDLDAPCTSALKETLRQTLIHRSLLNPLLCLRTPDQAFHQKVLVEELRAALKQGDEAERLKQVQRRWEERDRARPKHLAEYELSLGLQLQASN
jgi:multiple sugar transport system substrate-binding protein